MIIVLCNCIGVFVQYCSLGRSTVGMVRTYKKITEQGTPADLMRTAVKKIIEDGTPLREVSTALSIPRGTLQRYVKDARSRGTRSMEYQKTKATRQVFTSTQEVMLKEYLITASKHHHGLTKKQTRELAWQYAKRSGVSYPSKWDENNIAGEDWISGFLKRHKELSCRKPEATSLSRSTSFNRVNVSAFFDNLENIREKHNFDAGDIWNMDETALTTVHKPPKVIAERSARQVGQVTSAERGTLTTMIAAVNAAGGFIPPMMIFPRVNYRPHMITGAPTGTIGAANPSGWTSSEIFVQWLNHFIRHTRVTKQRPVLLTMDNHESHMSIEAIDLAKDNGIVLLTFPPHCSHKMQPLDVSVYGPLKQYYDNACNAWQLDNAGQTLTIYNIAQMLGVAFPRAFVTSNIQSGFRKAGIFEFNRHIFQDYDFLGSYVTDRPAPSSEPVASCSYSPSSGLQETTSMVVANPLTPDQVRPHPKAGPRKTTRGSRKRRSTSILTDTPVKDRLRREAEERAQKKVRGGKVICNNCYHLI